MTTLPDHLPRSIRVAGREFPIEVEYRAKRHSSAMIRDGAVVLRITNRIKPADREHHLQVLLQRMVSRLRHAAKLGAFVDPLLEDGSRFTLLGKPTQLVIQSGAKRFGVSLQEDQLILKENPQDSPNQTRRKLYHWLGKQLQPELEARVRRINAETIHSDKLRQISFRQQQSRWGSCSHNGNVRLSTRLIFVPEPLIDYVILHELCHLREMNHSMRFWKLVGNFMPDHNRLRTQLLHYI